ncbi:MAG: ATP-binding protein, partial [Bdellovibrionales bacterium]|nr:ATP-binding protein [Bdellovibrionales bacterium]
HKELSEVLKSLRGREVILLDEISFVAEWWRAIKHEIDRDDTKILVVTGSHAVDLRKGMDQMPGRWGGGGEFHLLPMGFDEFSAMRRQAKWPEFSRIDEMELYFRVGGFPIALMESGPRGKDPEKARETYRRWLAGDLQKLGRQEAYLKELLLEIAKTTTSTLSLQNLAKKTQIGSHHTAQEYISLLSDCFALKTLYAFEEGETEYRFRREKKFYFTDPLLYWIAFEWADSAPPDNAYEKVAELVAHESLRRRFQRIGYLKNRKGEVDFIEPGHWALEVKWAEIPKNISKLYKDLKIPQKIIWTKSNFLSEFPTKI